MERPGRWGSSSYAAPQSDFQVLAARCQIRRVFKTLNKNRTFSKRGLFGKDSIGFSEFQISNFNSEGLEVFSRSPPLRPSSKRHGTNEGNSSSSKFPPFDLLHFHIHMYAVYTYVYMHLYVCMIYLEPSTVLSNGARFLFPLLSPRSSRRSRDWNSSPRIVGLGKMKQMA